MRKRIILILLTVMSLFMAGFVRQPKSDRREALNITPEQSTGLPSFLSESSEEVLALDSENPIYSPLGLYFTLSMMAETLSDEVRAPILTFLKMKSMEELRSINSGMLGSLADDVIAKEFKLRNFHFRDSGKESLYKQEIVDLLKSNYHANDYSIDLINDGPSRLSEAIKDATNGFLEASPQALAPYFNDPQLANVLLNVLYFKDDWAKVFSENQILKKDFNLNSSTKVSVDMLCGRRSGRYLENDYYKVGSLSFQKGSQIHFILPQGDHTVSDCLHEMAISNIIYGDPVYDVYNIDYQIPKFDVSYRSDLTGYLIDKGLDQVFAFRDDSPFIEASFAYLTVGQVSRIKLDEQGVKAASATYGCGGAKSAAPQEPKTMYLDRPFIYFIEYDNIILFAGIINKL